MVMDISAFRLKKAIVGQSGQTASMIRGNLLYKTAAFICLFTAAVLISACRNLEISGGAFELSKSEVLSRVWLAQVVGVTDGDTIKVRLQGQGEQIKIRLYGIDAPEKGQPYGRKSREFLVELAVIGATVTIEPVNFDRYGRLVAIIYSSDGHCLNSAMVEAGLAWVYPQYCRQPICDSWNAAEHQARQSGLGLWHDQHPAPPWEWRKSHR